MLYYFHSHSLVIIIEGRLHQTHCDGFRRSSTWPLTAGESFWTGNANYSVEYNVRWLYANTIPPPVQIRVCSPSTPSQAFGRHSESAEKTGSLLSAGTTSEESKIGWCSRVEKPRQRISVCGRTSVGADRFCPCFSHAPQTTTSPFVRSGVIALRPEVLFQNGVASRRLKGEPVPAVGADPDARKSDPARKTPPERRQPEEGRYRLNYCLLNRGLDRIEFALQNYEPHWEYASYRKFDSCLEELLAEAFHYEGRSSITLIALFASRQCPIQRSTPFSPGVDFDVERTLRRLTRKPAYVGNSFGSSLKCSSRCM